MSGVDTIAIRITTVVMHGRLSKCGEPWFPRPMIPKSFKIRFAYCYIELPRYLVEIGQMPHTDSKGCFGFAQYSSQEQTHIIIFNKTSLDHRSNANTETGEKESISICAKEKWPGELCLRWWGNRCNHMQQ